MNRHSPRPRIQRAFVQWLDKNQSRFLIPVRIKGIRANFLQLEFMGITREISASLRHTGGTSLPGYDEMLVPVEWNGTTWDYLLWLDAAPLKSGDGYVCDACEPAQRIVYRDRESMWRDHLFEPFLNWVNTSLAPAKWLALHGVPDRSTSATLLMEKPEPLASEQTCIPVRDER